jgi:hypothetical protein
MLTADALAKVKAGQAPRPEWEAFRQQLMGGKVKFPSREHPFLFAGDCERLGWSGKGRQVHAAAPWPLVMRLSHPL